jgi:hypothetical protein
MRGSLFGLSVGALAVGIAAFAVPAQAAPYDVIVTPDQFVVQTWGANISQDTAGAYPGDNASGYYYTESYGNTPSGTIVIPLPAGMPSGAHQYNIYEWNPDAHRGNPEGNGQWHVVDIAGDGTLNNNPNHDPATGIPWTGAFGSNHQYLQNPQNGPVGAGWLKLGPGPQSDSTLDGGSAVWMNPSTGNGYPYLQIHYLGFENSPETFDAFRIVQVDAVPEPTTMSLAALGGLGLLARRRRR